MKEAGTAATMQLGQRGVTDTIVEELRLQVKKRKVVKVKALKTTPGLDKGKSLFQDLADRARVRLLEVRGHTAVFCDWRYETERDRKKRKRTTTEARAARGFQKRDEEE